jgi:hypothetical protein
MSRRGNPDPERLRGLARPGSGPSLGQLPGLYRAYLLLLARSYPNRRLQGKLVHLCRRLGGAP